VHRPGLIHQHPHALDRAFQAAEDRLADQEMPDVQFHHVGNRCYRSDRIETQAVAGMALEAERLGLRRRLDDPLQLQAARLAFGLAIAPTCSSTTGAPSACAAATAPRGLDEQRNPDAGAVQATDQRRQVIMLARRVEAAFGGALLALLRHQAAGMRLVPQSDFEHLRGRRHFQVERQIDLAAEPADILVGDMAAILAQVRGDAVGARLRRQPRGTDRSG